MRNRGAQTVTGGARRYHGGGPGAGGSLVAVVLGLAGVAEVPRRAGWEESANCATVDPDLFYPPQGGTPRPALRVCAVCPVRRQCLRFAIENGERYGVWGGLSEDQRRALRRRARRLLRDREHRGG